MKITRLILKTQKCNLRQFDLFLNRKKTRDNNYNSKHYIISYWECVNFIVHRDVFLRTFNVLAVVSVPPPTWFIRGVMVLNATCNNISIISWLSVLLVKETGVSGENHRPAASH